MRGKGLVLPPLWLAGFILLAIGAERLLNVYMIGGSAATHSTRVVLGWMSAAAGGALLAILILFRVWSRGRGAS